MKLLRCYIGEYRVLRKLDLTFRPGLDARDSIALDFLVGPNGCGKSTVLQAIAEIIGYLERAEPVPFPFLLEYELTGNGSDPRTITVANCDPNERPVDVAADAALVIQVDGNATTLSRELLPEAVMILTTGKEDEWDRVVHPDENSNDTTGSEASTPQPDLADERTQLEQRALSELPGSFKAPTNADGTPDQSSRILLARARLLPLITLCGVLAEMQRHDRGTLGPLQSVFEYAAVQRICGFSLRFRLNEGIATEADRAEVERIAAQATRSLRLGSDRLLVFDLTQQPQHVAQALLRRIGSSFKLYTTLARMAEQQAQAENVLQEVSIFIERGIGQQMTDKSDETHPAPPLLMLASLSDGERSFLGRMCLFSMLRGQEALVLLDEPEVHFNDYWKRQIVYLLEQTMQDQASHALITTHSSITLTDVPNDDIIVLHRGGNYTERSGSPRIPTLAADPSDIMVHVFGSPYAAGERGVRQIHDVLNKVGQQRGGTQREVLERLQKQVGQGYWSYRIRRALQQV